MDPQFDLKVLGQHHIMQRRRINQPMQFAPTGRTRRRTDQLLDVTASGSVSTNTAMPTVISRIIHEPHDIPYWLLFPGQLRKTEFPVVI